MFSTALSRAAYEAHGQIPRLLACGADPNARCPNGRAALSFASGLSPGIILLARVTTRYVDVLGQSPLHRAAMRGDSALYDFLLACGYSAEQPDITGTSASQYLRRNLLVDDMLDVPLSRGEIQQTLHMDPNVVRRNPLASALLHRWSDLAQRLLDGGANPDLMLASGQTPRSIGSKAELELWRV